MRTVHKYPLEMTDLQAVQLPQGARLLTVQVQHMTAYDGSLVLHAYEA